MNHLPRIAYISLLLSQPTLPQLHPNQAVTMDHNCALALPAPDRADQLNRYMSEGVDESGRMQMIHLGR